MNFHLYAPPYSPYALVIDCPTCERQRRAYGQAYEWHGATITCAGCGEQWQGDEQAERPFAPGWRRKGIEYARKGLAKLGNQA